jgi:hypothetical protein
MSGMWPAARRLAECARLGERHWAALLAALRRLDWLSESARADARRAVVNAAGEFLEFVEWLARDLDLRLPEVHRNLAAEADRASLPMYRLAWRVAREQPDPPPGCDFAGWLAFLDRRARRARAVFPFEGLCSDPPRLGAADVETLFPGAERNRFLALVLHAGDAPPRSPRSAAVALLRAVRRCPTATPGQLAGWCREAWLARRLSWVPRGAFDRLPVRLRRLILAGTREGWAVRRLLLSPSFRARLAADPLSHPDTPAGIERRRQQLPEVLAAIRRRDFAHAGVAEQLAEPNNIPHIVAGADGWEAVWQPAADASWSRPSAAALAALGRLPASRTGELLRFLATAPGERLAEGESWGGLRLRLAPADWLATFAAGSVDSQVSLLADSWLSDHLVGDDALFDLLAAAFPHARPGAAVRSLVERWLRRAGKQVGFRLRLLDWLAERPEALAALPHAEELPTLLLRTLADRKVLPDAAEAARKLSPEFLRGLLGGDPGRLGWLGWSLTADLLELPDGREVLASFLNCLVQVDAGLLPEAVPDYLPPAAFGQLCDAWPVPLTSATAERLRAVGAPYTERPAWLLLLERLRKARQPVPERLRKLAVSGGQETLRAAFRAYPGAFAGHGPDLFALRPLLRFAFGNSRVARVVEQEVPRPKLVAQLDWVRQTWSHAPSISAALELALCFSLRDARFLCQLARQARPPRSPDQRGRTFDHLYRTFEIPRNRGGTRTVTAPSPRLKRLQRRLLANGFAGVPLHESARGFRTGQSILTNAAPHTGKELVINLDIDSFFPSTGYRLILHACRRLADNRLSPRALYLLADLCSHGGALPTGAPTSPAIGNIVLTPADRALAKAAARRRAVYTRYADDLTFSGPGDSHGLIPFVKKVLGQLGYRIERKKLNLFRRGRRQMVTGLVVNDRPNWPRTLRRLLRAAVDRRRRGEQPTWQGQPLGDDRLRGLIAFLNLTQPAEAARLRARLPDLYPQEAASP